MSEETCTTCLWHNETTDGCTEGILLSNNDSRCEFYKNDTEDPGES